MNDAWLTLFTENTEVINGTRDPINNAALINFKAHFPHWLTMIVQFTEIPFAQGVSPGVEFSSL